MDRYKIRRDNSSCGERFKLHHLWADQSAPLALPHLTREALIRLCCAENYLGLISTPQLQPTWRYAIRESLCICDFLQRTAGLHSKSSRPFGRLSLADALASHLNVSSGRFRTPLNLLQTLSLSVGDKEVHRLFKTNRLVLQLVFFDPLGHDAG